MKHLYTTLVAILLTTSLSARDVVNKVIARVNGENILYSTLQVPHITKGGMSLTLDEYITEELWVQRARERNILPMDEDIERNIASFKEEHAMVGLSDEAADQKLRELTGLTFEQYRTQLWRHYAAEQLKSIEMRNRSSVSEVEVRTYYDSHPVRLQAEYEIECAYLSEVQRDQWSTTRKKAEKLAWKKMGWMKHNNIAKHMRVIYTLSVGDCSAPITVGKQILVVKLVDKKPHRTQTLTERYHEIEMKLQKDKVARYAKEEQNKLRKDAVVTIL